MKYTVGKASYLEDKGNEIDVEVYDDVIFLSQNDKWLRPADPETPEHENLIAIENEQFNQLFEIFRRIKESRDNGNKLLRRTRSR